MDKRGYLPVIEVIKIIVIFLMGYVILKAFGVTI